MPQPRLRQPSRTASLLATGLCVMATLAVQAAETPAPATPPAPPAVAADPVLSPFGIGSSASRSKDPSQWIPQMAAIGVRDLRSCRTGWGGLEPEDGKWNWEPLDSSLDYLTSNGITTGGLLLGNPKWLKGSTRGLPTDNIPAWSTYVTEVVRHAKGRIHRWEVWNEPPNGTNNAPPADYAKIVVAAYDAAKAVDPGCLVGMATKSVHVNYLEQVIKAGAKGHYDYITLHPYEVLGTVTTVPGSEAIYMGIVPTVRRMLAAQDPVKVDVPIIFTEIGYDSKRSAEKQGQALVKAYTMGIAQGVACINWFEGRDGDSGPMGLIKGDGTLRPAYTAMAQMIKLLGRHPTYIGWVLLNDRHHGFVFQGVNGPVLSTWAATTAPDTVDFGQPVQLIDPLTGTVTTASSATLNLAPVLVQGVSAALVAQAKGSTGKPFPWGGDFSGATSVSVTMGEKNVEQGLHTHSADAIAADVLAYGGSARAGNVPGGSAFMVDPNFLSYSATPIEISVVVKRNAANDPAKLDLEYESTSGYTKATPYEIPDNATWHTATWRITDAQFVGTWAFNFRLNSGKYGIQSVTVTKLAK